MKTISIIIPCYNEEDVIDNLYDRLEKVANTVKNYQFEFLFINDGSTDQTVDLVKKHRLLDKRISLVDLSRNFGKEIAMAAGFDYALGDAVVIIDADLQQPPELINEMIFWWEKGYDDVYAIRKERQGERWFKKLSSKIYYKLLQKMSKVNIYPNAGDFRLLDKKCIDALKKLKEQERYTKGLYGWIGFKKKEIAYDADPRAAGETKWRYSSLVHLALNGITSYTTLPLKVSSIAGIIVSFTAFIYMVIVLVKTLFFGADVAGYPSLMIGILFLGGIQLIFLGVLGEYIGRIFNETKNRPLYFVEEYLSSDETNKY